MGCQLSKRSGLGAAGSGDEWPRLGGGGAGGGRLLRSGGRSSPVGVPISVVVAQKVILPHHLVSSDFQWLVDRRQEIFT